MPDPATGLTAGIIVLMMMAMGGGKKKKGCPPFQYNKAKVELSIASAISGGMRGRETIAVVVATSMWPTHPKTGKRIQWPPAQNAGKDVKCLWRMLLKHIDEYLKKKRIPPWPPCPPGQEIDVGAQRCVEPTPPVDEDPDDGFPPFDPGPWETPPDADYPDPGTLLQVRYGDRLSGNFSAAQQRTGSDAEGQALRSIAYTTLLSAGWLAAKENGATDEEAGRFSRLVANDNNNRLEYIQLIQCSPYNDALYTTFGYGPKAVGSPVGRALRFLPMHYNNRGRLMRGLAPRRNITLGTPGDKNSGNSYGQDEQARSFAYIWLPKINLQILWDSGGKDVTTSGVTWPDGSNGIMPPPEVLRYGVENVPDSVAWGCLGFETTTLGD